MKKHRKLREKLLEANGYAGNVGQLDKGYDLQGKVTYSATPLARNKKVPKCKIPLYFIV